MTYTNDLNAPNGTKLTAIGFQQLQGTSDDAQVFNNRISRSGTSGGKLFYSPAQDTGSSGTQSVKMDQPKEIRLGLCVYASVTNNLLTAYYIRSEDTFARIFKIVNGGTATLLSQTQTIPDDLGLELRVTKNGSGQPVLEAFRLGVSISTPYTDTTSPILSGRRGIAYLDSNSVSGDPAGDNYEDNSDASAPPPPPPPPPPSEDISFAITEKPNGFPWESKRTPAQVKITGTYTGAPAAIWGRLLDGDFEPVPGFDWAEKITSPSEGTFEFTFDSPPDSARYYAEVDDGSGNYIVTTANHFRVNPIIIIGPAQSQDQYFWSFGKGELLPTPEAAELINVLHSIDPAGRSSRAAEFAPLDGNQGSGAVAAGNRIALKYGKPCTLVELGASGTSIRAWLEDDVINAGLSDWTTYTGYATAMLSPLEGQATEAVSFWGTALISKEATTPGSYALDIETLMAKISADFFDHRLHTGVFPHPRSNDDGGENGSNWRLRNAQYQFAISGNPNFSFAGWILDPIMGSNGNPHQAQDGDLGIPNAGEIGNERYGDYVGDYIAARLNGVPISGPNIIAANWKNDSTKDRIVLKYDADYHVPSGKTTDLPQYYVSADGWAAVGYTGYRTTGEAIDARTVEVVHPTGGNWLSASKVDVDYIRDTPWDSQDGKYGGEAGVAVLVDDLLHGTDDSDGGRGLIASPIMGEGMTVQPASAPPPPPPPPPPLPPTSTITQGQTATFGIPQDLLDGDLSISVGDYTLDGTQEPVAIRWTDANGVTHGINVEITTS